LKLGGIIRQLLRAAKEYSAGGCVLDKFFGDAAAVPVPAVVPAVPAVALQDEKEEKEKNTTENRVHKLLAALSELGLKSDIDAYNHGLVVEAALKTYKKLHVPAHREKFTVSQLFEVPTGTTAEEQGWPVETWGLHLGRSVYGVHQTGNFSRWHEVYAKLGLILIKPREHHVEQVITALKVFKKVIVLKNSRRYRVVPLNVRARRSKEESINLGRKSSSDLSEKDAKKIQFFVPQSFVVPVNSDIWPPETWGMKLGQRARNIRFANAWPEKRSVFVALGLSIGSKKQQKQKLNEN
jgi:hypothetical protein